MRARAIAVGLAALTVSAGVALGAGLFRNGGSAAFEVLAHVDPGGGYGGDVVLHDQIAYLSSHRGSDTCFAAGVRVFDLHDPRQPRRVATFADGVSAPVLAESWTEKTVVRTVATPSFTGTLAVTSVQACSPREGGFQGFALYDVSRPANPRRLALVRTEPRGSHEIWLQRRGARVYVYTAITASEIRSSPDGDTPGEPDFRIYDVSDPRSPMEVGGWGAWKELGLRPFEPGAGPLDGNFVHSVLGNAAGTRAYLSYWRLGTVILDVSDPTRPRYLGRTRGDTANTHSAWLDERRNLLVETHERTGGRPIFYRLRGSGDPVALATLTLPRRLLTEGHRRGGLSPVSGITLTDSVHDAKLDGTTAYLSWYSQGVVAADISDPTKPKVIARFLPRPGKDPERLLCPDHPCVAVWGMDIGPDYVVAADMISGLWVLKLNR